MNYNMNEALEWVIIAYKEAIHFTENEEDANNPAYTMMGITPDSEFSEETNKIIESDCQKAIEFAEKNFPNLLEDSDMSIFGHDFWFTRNGHGEGFWDGDWAEGFGNKMTEYCKSIGEKEAYAGDNGLIYFV